MSLLSMELESHLHVIVLDGVYSFNGDIPRFHVVKAPTSTDMVANQRNYSSADDSSALAPESVYSMLRLCSWQAYS